MQYTMNVKESALVVSKDGAEIEFSFDEIERMARAIEEDCYYLEDVMARLEELVADGDMPEAALKNADYIDALLDEYKQLRFDADGDADGMSWDMCLDEAFERVRYASYES